MSVDKARYARLNELLDGALERDGDERATYLDERCAADPELRREVLELIELATDDDTRDPFAEPAIRAAHDALRGIVRDEGLADDASWIPERIGAYRIVRSIGMGGMGVVYEAEQESPRRRVAIKLLHPLHATPERLRRFRHEAELLGRLQHPNIAQIHEAGFYDAGRGPQPFFAMELVEGVDLRTHCRRERLGTLARLSLLAKVCDGVQFAHERGVIHRDLKPENVLVDGFGQPKILDFGVARASDSSTVLSTIVTQEGQLVGTLAYMAPEQFRTSADRITERADVYALGVLGFELLTGRLPHLVADFPISAAVALLAGTDAPRAGTISPELRGDLETILGKALETEPARRYPSAAALGDDLRRFLDHVPIRARPPTRLYRVAKFTRRHRGLTVGALATVLTLTAGLVVAGVLAGRERDQRLRADASVLDMRRSEARVASGLMDSIQTSLAAGRTWEALERHRLIPEASRGWGWRLLARRLPELLDVESGLPDIESQGRPEVRPPRWRFLDDDRIVAADVSRDAVVIRSLVEPGREELRGEGLGLVRLGEATPTGLVLGHTDGETLLLDLRRDAVLERWPTGPSRDPGHVSDDGRTVVVQTAVDAAEVHFDGRLRHELDCSGPSNALAWPHCRVSPDGRTVFVNRLTEVLLLDVESGEERLARPHDGFDRIVAHGLDDGWMTHQYHDSDAPRRTASRRQTGWPPVLDEPTPEDVRGRFFRAPRNDGRFVVTEGPGGFRVKDATTGERVRVCPEQENAGIVPTQTGFVRVCEVSPSGRRLMCLSLDRLPCIVDLDPRRLEPGFDPRCRTYRGHNKYLYHLAVSHDGALVASASAGEPLVRVWDSRTLETVCTLERRSVDFASRDALLAFSSDDTRLVMTTPMPDADGAVVVDWDLIDGEVTTDAPEVAVTAGNHAPLLDRFIARLRPLPRARLSQKAQMVDDHALAVWYGYEFGFSWPDREPDLDADRWRVVPQAGRAPTAIALALAVHPVEDVVAVVTADQAGPGAFSPTGTLTIREIGSGKPLAEARLTRQPWCVAWSPDGARLTVGCNDGHVLVFETEFLTLQHDFQAHGRYIYSLAWMPDGERLVTLSEDATLRVWDPRPAAVKDAEVARWKALRAGAATRPDLDRAWRGLEGLERSAARIEAIRRGAGTPPR